MSTRSEAYCNYWLALFSDHGGTGPLLIDHGGTGPLLIAQGGTGPLLIASVDEVVKAFNPMALERINRTSTPTNNHLFMDPSE